MTDTTTTTLPASLREIASARADLTRLAFPALKIRKGWNGRDMKSQETLDHIDWLEKSIEKFGVREPLRGYFDKDEGKFVVTGGECRTVAMGRLHKRGVEVLAAVIPEDRNANEGDYLATLLLENSGKPLDAMEKASVYARLKKYGWTTDQIANVSQPRITAAQVENMLKLDGATPATKAMVKSGKVKPTTAVNAIRKDGPEKAEAVLASAVEEAEATGKKVTGKAVAAKASGKSAPKTSKPAKISPAAKNAEEQEKALTLLKYMMAAWPEMKCRRLDDGCVITMKCADYDAIESILEVEE